MLSSVVGLDKQVGAAIIAGCVTLLVSVISVVYTQQKTNLREIANSHRPQKIEIYKNFMNQAIVGLLKASKEKKFDDPEYRKELEDFFFHNTGEFIVWGSPEVIKAYSAFRGAIKPTNEIVFEIDDLLQAMRKDLGNSNKGLKRGELIQLFVSSEVDTNEILNSNKE